MKKIYLLLLLMLSSIGFGQASDLIISEYAEGTVGNSKYVEIFNGTGADVDLASYRIWTIANGGTWPEGTINLTGILANNDTFVIANNLTDVPGADLYNTNVNWNGDDAVGLAKDIATVWTLIDAVGTDGVDPGNGWAVAGTANGTANFKLVRKPSICSPNTNWAASAGTDTTNSEWEVLAYTTGSAGNGHVNTCITTPSILITSPLTGTIFSPETTSVNITLAVSNFNVANGTGDGHIHYTINGGGVNMKYDTTPIVLPTTPGTYTIYAELVDNAHNPIAPAQNTTITFTVATYNVVANLAALRADVIANGAGKYYQVSSNPVISYARATRNQKYIQDASAGILIDDIPGTISTAMANGDAISGLKGQASLFSGLLQLLPTTNATIASSGNTIIPQIVTAADIVANVEAYESELVQINNSTFTAADGVATFLVNTNNNLNDGTTDIIFRTLLAEANYIGQVIPSGAANRAVLVAKFNTTPQVVSRNLADVTLSKNSFNAIAGLKVYPNPAKNILNITSNNFETKNVEIYNVLGAKVLTAKVTNAPINVASLTSGVYVVKVTEDGKTATRKLVIE